MQAAKNKYTANGLCLASISHHWITFPSCVRSATAECSITWVKTDSNNEHIVHNVNRWWLCHHPFHWLSVLNMPLVVGYACPNLFQILSCFLVDPLSVLTAEREFSVLCYLKQKTFLHFFVELLPHS